MKTAAVALAVALLATLIWAQLPQRPLPQDARATRLVVHKERHVLELYAGEKVLKTYAVSLGRGGLRPKQVQGDGRTPEGHYTLDSRNPKSSFHLALHVSYPSPSDSVRAKSSGADPGGLIMVHGLPNHLGWLGRLHRLIDWTDGCVAVTNPEMEELWRAVPTGTEIDLVP